jgi:CHRD domain
MRRRVFHVLGLALLLVTAIAVPAKGATCSEYYLSLSDIKGQVAANMDGRQVVSSSGTLGVGDPDGTGTVVLTLQSVVNQNAEVAYQIGTNNIAIPLEGAHIHHAVAGQTGLNVVTLFGFTDQPDRSGVVMMSKCLAHDIFHNPTDFYVDVHNQVYPDQGAIRGQLSNAV